ncbi:MAG: hypothetical protein RL258_936, partial [Pseudomonadota bacterium]
VQAQVNEGHAHHFRTDCEDRRANGAGGGTRTRTPSRAPDFESGASTNSTTPAVLSGM